MNQVGGGSATLSRYGIWATTARDHLAGALDAMDAGRVDEARELIVKVANALTAFAAVQRAIDEDQERA